MTKICFSGCEGEGDYSVLHDVGCKNVLVSYMHLSKGSGERQVLGRKRKEPDLFLFVDSGGFTLRSDLNYLERKKMTLRQYGENYLAWLYANHASIDCAANVDLLELEPEFTKWMDKELRLLEEKTGLPIVYVWHATTAYGPQMWEHFCNSHRYIGFNAQDAASDGTNASAMLSMARKHGVKVHGFAITNTDALGRDLFYSVDSSTWIMGAKYGRTMAWTGTEFRQFDGDNKQRRQQYRQHYIDKGVDWSLIEQDGKGIRSKEIRAECLKMNAIAWMDYQSYIDTRMRPRSWWIDLAEAKKRLPDIDQATSNEVLAFYESIKYESGWKEADDIKAECHWLFAFASRDWKTVKDVDTQEIIDYASFLCDSSDVAATGNDRVRLIDLTVQKCLGFLVPASFEKPKERTMEVAQPLKEQPKARTKVEDTPDAPPDAEETPLPNPVQGELSEPEMDPQNTPLVQGLSPSDESEHTPDNLGQGIAPDPYPPFVQGLADETLRLRARMLVDAHLRHIAAKREYASIVLLRGKEGDRKAVKKSIIGTKTEIKFIGGLLTADTRKQIEEWCKQQHPSPDVVLPPVRSYPITKENAAEVGSLGGAPKGNINAIRHGIYSKKLPALACDTCPIAGQCYMHRPGHVCAFDKEFKKLKIVDLDSAVEVLQSITNTDLERVQRQLVFETVQGGVANTDTSALLNATFQKVDKVRELMKAQQAQTAPNMFYPTTITETTTKQLSGPASILQALFKNVVKAPIIDLEVERAKAVREVIEGESEPQ